MSTSLHAFGYQPVKNRRIEETGTSGLLSDMKHYNCHDNKYLCFSTQRMVPINQKHSLMFCNFNCLSFIVNKFYYITQLRRTRKPVKPEDRKNLERVLQPNAAAVLAEVKAICRCSLVGENHSYCTSFTGHHYVGS